MRFASIVVVCLVVWCGQISGGAAQTRFLGLGGFGTNDRLGDERDRWRTGSYELTVAYGKRWGGAPPPAPSAILGVRARAEVISPHPIEATGPDQRLYAGVLGVGLQGFTRHERAEIMAGVDLIVLGPQTRLDHLQRFIHKADDGGNPPPPDEQLGDAFVPTAYAELGQTFGGTLRARPFAEVQAGYESFARVGLDISLGGYGRDALMTRDVVSGQRYPVIMGPARRGLSLVAGGDIAVIANSRLFPSRNGPEERLYRPRGRVGAAWDSGRVWAFFGVAWLGREYEGAPSGQRIGTVTFNVRF